MTQERADDLLPDVPVVRFMREMISDEKFPTDNELLSLDVWDIVEYIDKLKSMLTRSKGTQEGDQKRGNALGCLSAFEKVYAEFDGDITIIGENLWYVMEHFETIRAALEQQLTIADYEETLADHCRLVRELDVLLCGEDGAAKQASLCDIVGMVQRTGTKLLEPGHALVPIEPTDEMYIAGQEAAKYGFYTEINHANIIEERPGLSSNNPTSIYRAMIAAALAQPATEQRRSTTLFDINGNEIFEGDIVLTPHTDKPYSRNKKEKNIRGVVQWVEAKADEKTVGGTCLNIAPHWRVDFTIDPDHQNYPCGNWSDFYRCEKELSAAPKQEKSE